jgi:hypothetical protein
MRLSAYRPALLAACDTLLATFALAGQANAQSAHAPSETNASPWDRQNAAARHADAWFGNYKFRNGETIAPSRMDCHDTRVRSSGER